jgi:hypothetical protein
MSFFAYTIYGTATIFVVLVLWFCTTMFFNQFTATVSATGNFSDTAINTSFQNMVTRNTNMWNLWPIVAIVMAFIFLYLIASNEDDYKAGGMR